jgi:hypothetical protein
MAAITGDVRAVGLLKSRSLQKVQIIAIESRKGDGRGSEVFDIQVVVAESWKSLGRWVKVNAVDKRSAG